MRPGGCTADAVITVAVMMCAVLTGCSTHRKVSRQTDVETVRHSMSTASVHTMTVEEMQQMMQRNEHLHIILYDTKSPIDNSTGRHPVAAEIWNDTEATRGLTSVKENYETSENEEAVDEAQSAHQKEKTDMAAGNGTAVALWWWIAAAMVSLLWGVAELKRQKK